MPAVEWREKLKALAVRACVKHSLELYDLEMIRAGRRWVVRVVLDSVERPVTLNDCEAVSRDLSAMADMEDAVPHAYTLEVSSPGLERKLKKPGDYERFRGERAFVVYDAISGNVPQGFIKGEIAGVSEEAVTIRPEKGPALEIPFQKIKRANLVFEFSK